MIYRSILIGVVLVIGLSTAPRADGTERTFVRQSLSAIDFPLAPETMSGSVIELVALLERVRVSEPPRGVLVRTYSLEEVVRSRTWRKQVSHRLVDLLP